MFDNKVCEYINHMLRVGRFKGCSLEQVTMLVCFLFNRASLCSGLLPQSWKRKMFVCTTTRLFCYTIIAIVMKGFIKLHMKFFKEAFIKTTSLIFHSQSNM